jgi:hypothetical protein
MDVEAVYVGYEILNGAEPSFQAAEIIVGRPIID